MTAAARLKPRTGSVKGKARDRIDVDLALKLDDEAVQYLINVHETAERVELTGQPRAVRRGILLGKPLLNEESPD